MTISIYKLAGAAALVVGLSGCVDMTMEIEILDEATATGTMTMVMDKEMYDMMQAQGGEDFCEDDGVMTVDENGATCVSTQTGTFEEVIDADPGEDAPSITALGDGTVRVTFPTGTLDDEFAGVDEDPSQAEMMAQLFAGKSITLRASGGEVVDTNMTIAEDGMSASFSVPFLDLINGTAELPDESYAVIRVR